MMRDEDHCVDYTSLRKHIVITFCSLRQGNHNGGINGTQRQGYGEKYRQVVHDLTKKGVKGGRERIHFKSAKVVFGQANHFVVMPAEVTAPAP